MVARERREAGGRGAADGLLGRLVVLAVAVGLPVVAVAAYLGRDGRYAFLDEEKGLAAAVSALALVLAGAVCLVAGVRARGGVPLCAVGGLLVLMALDEWFVLHEGLERAAGLDWQLLYLPVMAVAAVSWLLVLRAHRARAWFVRAWVLGAVLWGVSQVLELVQWDGDVRRPGFQPMMVTEELLELMGTGLLLLAAASLLLDGYGRSSTLMASRRSMRS